MAVRSERSVGARLRKARAARGVALNDAFEDTRINKRFLEALERDASPEEFPAPVYARAFLERYARYLKLDPDPLLDEYRQAHGELPPPEIRLLRPVEQHRGPWLKVALTVASVAALVALTLLAVRAGQEPEAVSVPEQPAPPAASPTATASPAAPEPEAPLEGVRLVISVTEAPCWVQVARGEEILLQETLEPGSSHVFRAGPNGQLDIILGDAGAANLRLNGESLGSPGDPGQVYQASVLVDDGRATIVPVE